MERATCAVKKGNARGRNKAASAPTFAKDNPTSLQVKDAMALYHIKKKKSKRVSVCQIVTRGQPSGIFFGHTSTRTSQSAVGGEWGARLSGSRTCFGRKICHFLHLQKGRVLVGRSSDRKAMVDHPEPLHETMPFKAEFGPTSGWTRNG